MKEKITFYLEFFSLVFVITKLGQDPDTAYMYHNYRSNQMIITSE